MRDLSVRTDEPGTWPEALAGAVPFIVYGLAAFVFSLNQNHILTAPGPFGWDYLIWAIFIGNIVSAAIFCVGWVRGFPRWSYAVLLPMWYNTDWLSQGGSFGRPSPFEGIKAWLPLLIGMGATLLWSRSLTPLWQFVKGAWQDWTRFSFLIYGFLIVMVLISIDESYGMALIAHTVTGTVFLVAGAVAYIRASRITTRILALVLGMASGLFIVDVFVEAYSNGRYELWTKSPQPSLDASSPLIRLAVILTIYAMILLSPVLIALFRQGFRRVSA